MNDSVQVPLLYEHNISKACLVCVNKFCCGIIALELMNQSGQFPSQAIMNATFGGSQSKAGTTPQLVEKCMAVDEQGSKLLPHRDDLVLKIKAIMQEYTTVLRYLLPKNYFATSHHCRWMVVFQSALGGLPVEGVEAAQQLVPKVEKTQNPLNAFISNINTIFLFIIPRKIL